MSLYSQSFSFLVFLHSVRDTLSMVSENFSLWLCLQRVSLYSHTITMEELCLTQSTSFYLIYKLNVSLATTRALLPNFCNCGSLKKSSCQLTAMCYQLTLVFLECQTLCIFNCFTPHMIFYQSIFSKIVHSVVGLD